MIFSRIWWEERKIRNNMLRQAKALVVEQHRKDADIRKLRASDLTSAGLQHMIDAAGYQGSITVKLVDGTEITVDNTQLKEAREQLNRLSDRFAS